MSQKIGNKTYLTESNIICQVVQHTNVKDIVKQDDLNGF